jgi:hypothetical protein
MNMIKDVLLFWPRFFKEAYYFRKFYKATKTIEPELAEQGLRVDWLGRIYTVLNLKDEALQQPDVVQQSMIFQSLKPTNDILMKYGLSNDAFPTIKKLSQKSYLVILYPEADYFNVTSFISNFVLLATVGGSVWAVLTYLV